MSQSPSQVLELTLLRTLPSTITTTNSTLSALQTVRSTLASRVHPTHSRFYRSLNDPSKIYILGLWDSVEQHRAFLDSKQCAEILAPQEGMLGFEWGTHCEFSSANGEGDEGIENLGAVIGIARFGDRVGSDWDFVTGRMEEMSVETGGVVHAGRVLGEGDGREEMICFFSVTQGKDIVKRGKVWAREDDRRVFMDVVKNMER